MANLERTHYQPMKFLEGHSDDLPWIVDAHQLTIPKCPQIFFDSGEPWLAANLYAVARLERQTNIKTVLSDMNHLRDYAEWSTDKLRYRQPLKTKRLHTKAFHIITYMVHRIDF